MADKETFVAVIVTVLCTWCTLSYLLRPKVTQVAVLDPKHALMNEVRESPFKMDLALNQSADDLALSSAQSLARMRDRCPYFAKYNVTICTYPAGKDRFISARLLAGIMWEERLVTLLLGWLRTDPGLVLIDVGANIGVFSLVAAAAGRRVLAVEPLPENLALLHASMARSPPDVAQLITVVPFAVSTARTNVTLKTDLTNRGFTVLQTGAAAAECRPEPGLFSCSHSKAVLLDDLLDVPGFRHHQAVLKIDIEGHELPTLLASKLFWERLYIPVVMMEWQWVILKVEDGSRSRQTVDRFLKFMTGMGYEAFSMWRKKLHHDSYMTWPLNVFWAKGCFRTVE